MLRGFFNEFFSGVYLSDPPKDRCKKLATYLLPQSEHRQYNFALLDLGRQICRYTDPRCGDCPVVPSCDYFNQKKAKGIRDLPGRYHVGIAEKVRAKRLAKGLSLHRLAASAGLSKLTLIRIESGRSSPRPQTLAKLARALNISVEDIA